MPLTRMKSYRPNAQAPRFGQPARWRGRALQQSREHFFLRHQWVAPPRRRRFTLTNASTAGAIGQVTMATEGAAAAAAAGDGRGVGGRNWSCIAPRAGAYKR